MIHYFFHGWYEFILSLLQLLKKNALFKNIFRNFALLLWCHVTCTKCTVYEQVRITSSALLLREFLVIYRCLGLMDNKECTLSNVHMPSLCLKKVLHLITENKHYYMILRVFAYTVQLGSNCTLSSKRRRLQLKFSS